MLDKHVGREFVILERVLAMRPVSALAVPVAISSGPEHGLNNRKGRRRLAGTDASSVRRQVDVA